MAQGTSVGEIFLDLKVNDRTAEGIEKGAKNADKVANQRGIKTGGIFADGFTKGLKNLVAAGAIIGGIVAISKKLVDAGMEAAEATNRLAVTMHNATGATAEQIDSIAKLTEEYQRFGVVSATAQQAGLQELATYVSQTESIERMLPVLNDMLAQQYGYNATAESAISISTMLGKVLQGQTAALSRYGYTFDEAQEKILKYGNEQQRVATLAEVVSQSVGGMNQALGSTPEGKIVQLRNNFGMLAEQMGSFLINILYPVINFLNNIVVRLNTILSQVNSLFGRNGTSGIVNSIKATGNAISQAYEDAGNAAEKASDQMGLASFDKLNTIGKTETASTSVPEMSGGGGLGDLSGLTQQAKEMEKLSLKDMFDKWQNDIHEGWQKVLKKIQGINWKDVWNKVWDTLWGVVSSIHWGDLFTDIFETLGTALGTATQIIVQGVSTLGEKIGTAIREYFEPFVEDAGGNVAVGFLNGMNAGLTNIAIWIGEHIVDPFMTGLLACFGIEWLPIKEKIKNAFLKLAETIVITLKQYIQDGWNKIVEFAENIIKKATDTIEKIKEFFEPIANWINENVIEPISKFFNKLFGKDIPEDSENASNDIQSVWEDVEPFFAFLLDGITFDFVDCFETIADTAFNKFEDVKDTIRDAVSSASDWLSDLWDSTTSYTRSIGSRISNALSNVSFPHFASGGYIDQPTLAMVGEGGQGEYIIPEDKLTAIVAKVLNEGNRGGIQGGNALSDNQTINITLELDGAVLARKQIKEINRISKAQGKPVFDY